MGHTELGEWSETESLALQMGKSISPAKINKEKKKMQEEIARALGHNPSASMILVNDKSANKVSIDQDLRQSGLSGIE